MFFVNRHDAAERLSHALMHWKGRNPLILAIPRGAIEIGRVIANRLDGELDVVLVRKLRAPSSPEFAVGAVAENGWSYIAPHAQAAGADDRYIDEEKRYQLNVLKERRQRYTPDRASTDARGRIAIVVDDGLATGATMVAALHAVRALQPARLICAVPVASPRGIALVRPLADEVVCLLAPEEFGSVGQFYRTFEQVEDEQASRWLSEPVRRTPPSP